MKAIVSDSYGPPDVLRLADVAMPVAGDDDVLVRVHAAGVDPSVWHLMAGQPYLIRLGFGIRRPPLRVHGVDVAGRVEAVGRNVTRFHPGDDVFGSCRGSFAEYACARESLLAPKPAGLDFEQAAAIPVSSYTALQSLRDAGKVKAGQQVLIIGAGGGVGTFAVQIAKVYGAEVTGVCSTSKMERKYDLILDAAGNRPLSSLRRLLTRRGTLVLVGGEGGGPWLGGIDRLLRALALSPFVSQRLRPVFARARAEDLRFVTRLVEAGKAVPVIDSIYSLPEAPEAVRHLARGHARGKIVIRVRT